MTGTYSGVALLGAVLALGACSSPQVASAPQNQTALTGVVCPPAGTIVTRDNGTRLRYGGTDPSDPATCLVGTPSGGTVRALGGIIATHPINAAERRQALAALFPLAPGKSSYVRYGLVSAALPSAHRIPFEESFQVVGERTVQLVDGPRQVWVVQGQLNSIADPNIRFSPVYEIDKENGAVLAFNNTSRTVGTIGPAMQPYRVIEMTAPSRQVADAR